jgi:IS5 family transposase
VDATDDVPSSSQELNAEALERAVTAREKRLSPLFRKWPALSRIELAELKRLYNERLLIARYLGRRRARKAGVAHNSARKEAESGNQGS